MFNFSSRPARVSTAVAAKSRRSVASPQQPDWIAIRRKDRPQDMELAPHAARWWHTLPSDMRPVHLVQKYPRIVNLLSLCWDDKRLIRETFESLLQDKRGTRQGFPTMIVSELRRLREYAGQTAPEAPRAELLSPNLWKTDARGDDAGSAQAANLSDAWDMHWGAGADR